MPRLWQERKYCWTVSPGYLGERPLLEAKKRTKVGLVSGHRVGGQPTLDGEMLQKTLQQFKPLVDGRPSSRKMVPSKVWKQKMYPGRPPVRGGKRIKKKPRVEPGFFINRDFSSG